MARGRRHHSVGRQVAVLPAACLPRALARARAVAVLFADLIMIGRDQVSLIALYVLAGFVLWHWLAGAGKGTGARARVRLSLVPLATAALAGAIIVTVPVLLTELLAENSNRPEIGYQF